MSLPDDDRLAANRTEPDWTDQVTDLIVDSVDKVRAKTTGPLLDFSRAGVLALVALIILLPILVMVIVGMVRFFNWLLPGGIWVSYVVMSVIFLIIGAVLWKQRKD